MPVVTVAQAMAIDAYKKYSQPIPEEPTDALILDNTGIYSTVQVQVYLGVGGYETVHMHVHVHVYMTTYTCKCASTFTCTCIFQWVFLVMHR